MYPIPTTRRWSILVLFVIILRRSWMESANILPLQIMNNHSLDSSNSGCIVDSFDGISHKFTDIEVLNVSEINVVARGKRYGRWWTLKGLTEKARKQAAYREMLRKEMEILADLQHPSVVSVVGLEEVEGLGLCIVMEWVDGEPLSTYIKDTTCSERRRLADELLSAVAYVHAKGIVHRDLKPSNIMVSRNGRNVKLIDFGVADSDSHTVLKQPAGTARYMSKEQAEEAKPDVRNDIYSLGIILRQMNLGRQLDPIVRRCMAPIEQRYACIAELQADIARKKGRRGRIAVVLAVLTIAMGLWWLGKTKPLPLVSSKTQTQSADTSHLSKVGKKTPEVQKESSVTKETKNEVKVTIPRVDEEHVELCHRAYLNGGKKLRLAMNKGREQGLNVVVWQGVGEQAIEDYIKSLSLDFSESERKQIKERLEGDLAVYVKIEQKKDSLLENMRIGKQE